MSLITDAYSRKIVGWALEDSLGAIGPVSALKMAIKDNKGHFCTNLIHHSDRGVQYCCREYIALLNHHSISISMTEQGDPYENALAERMNRTVKEEMLQNKCFANMLQAQEAVQRAILNYNTLRPHASCDYLTPEQAHRMKGELAKKWHPSKRREMRKVQPKDKSIVN